MTDRTHFRPHLTQLPERNLDVLRALAVSLVVGFHLTITAHHSSQSVSNLARGGVLLFFVHTSLVLMASLERSGDAPGWVKAFYTRRAFRIYPLAIAAVLLVTIFTISPRVPVAGVRYPFQAPGLRELAANFTLTQNLTGDRDLLGVLWSLPLEVQMYVVLPLCWLVARRSLRLAFAMVCVAIVAGVVYQADVVPGLWRISVVAFGPCFTAGVVAYAIMRHVPMRPQLPAWTLGLALIVPLVPLAIPESNNHIIPFGWLVALPIGCVVPFIAELRESWLTRGAKTVAKYSYGVYLLHGIAAWLGFVALRPQAIPLQFAVFAASLIGMPILAYHLVEAPMIRVGQSVVRRRARVVEPVAADQVTTIKAA